MNILAVVPYVPTPIRVRPYSLLRFLAQPQRGHRITLATLWENEAELQSIEALKAWGIDVIAVQLTKKQKALNTLRALPTRAPLQAWFCFAPELAHAIEQRLAQGDIDAVHVEHLRGAQYALVARNKLAAMHSAAPVVWDSVDCITHLFEQASQRSRSLKSKAITQLELARTRWYEGWLSQQFAHVLVTSATDKQALQKLSHGTPKANVHVLGNGVDLDYFSPGPEPHQPDTVVFSGKMSYHANITAALFLVHEVMPEVWKSKPNVKLVIAGSRPPTSITSLATSDSGGRIQVTGFVKDLRMPLRKAAVAVAPLLYGAGVQNKVLEAMACGTPVVAMSQAISALSVQPGAECLVADTAPTLAAAILSLLHDEDLRARMGAAGRRYVEDNHNWNAIIAHLENIYQRNTVDVQQPTTQPGSAPGELRHSGRSVPGVGANTATAQS